MIFSTYLSNLNIQGKGTENKKKKKKKRNKLSKIFFAVVYSFPYYSKQSLKHSTNLCSR